MIKEWFSELQINRKLAFCNGIVVFISLLAMVLFINFHLTDDLERVVLNNIDVSPKNEDSLDKETLLKILRGEKAELESLRIELELTIAIASLATLSFIILLNLQLVNILLKPLEKVKQAMREINEGILGKQLKIASKDEIGDICSSFNHFAIGLKQLIDKMRESTEFLKSISSSMGVSSKNVSNIAEQQMYGLKNIVNAMDEADSVAKMVRAKAMEVSKIAGETKKNVHGGCSIIVGTLEKITAIREHGKESVQSTKNLNEKMENVSQIIKTINGIASQTKIIAFNAELEAAAAGEAGNNFKIVAMEIRRLSDNIMSATNAIKMRIFEAQAMVDFIIVSSEENSAKIQEGWQESQKLNKVFDTILSSSEVSATSAEQISTSITDLVISFGQILETLKTLSGSIEGFAELTQVSTFTSETVNDISTDFGCLISKYKTS